MTDPKPYYLGRARPQVHSMVEAVVVKLRDHVPTGFGVVAQDDAIMVVRDGAYRDAAEAGHEGNVCAVASFEASRTGSDLIRIVDGRDFHRTLFRRRTTASVGKLAADLVPRMLDAIRMLQLHAARYRLMRSHGDDAITMRVIPAGKGPLGDDVPASLDITLRLSAAQVQALGERRLGAVVDLLRALGEGVP